MPPLAESAAAPSPDSRPVDALAVAAILLGIVALFLIDAGSPSGLAVTVGYAGIVAIAARFGRNVTLGIASLVCVLIVLPAFMQRSGRLVTAADVANHGFALIAVWIVAITFLHRFKLETLIVSRDAALGRHSDALLKIVHRALLGTLTFDERIACATEEAAKAVAADRVGIFRLDADGIARCADLYRTDTKTHDVIDNYPANRAAEYIKVMNRDMVVAIDDLLKVPHMVTARPMFRNLDVRSLLTAGIFIDGRMDGVLSLARLNEPRRWTEEEIVFARSLAGFVALIYLAERNRQTLDALDMIGEGIIVTGQDGSLFHANRFAKGLARLVADKERADAGDWLESDFPAGASPLVQTEDTQEIDFAGRELELQRAALPTGGMVTRIADRTLRNAAFRERTRLQEQLQQAAKMEAIGRLAGGVAHDFNNILGAISGFAGFLRQDLPPQSEQRGFAERILAACGRGKRLVEQILDFARARAVEHQIVDLENVLRGCGEFLQPLLPPSVTLHIEAVPRSAFVLGSAVQLSQMISNLCVNAKDAIGDGPGSILLSLAEVPATELTDLLALSGRPDEAVIGEASSTDRYARIRISDNGEGIAEDVLSRIFEPFFTTKGRHRGAGLGLAVVHGVVSAHNGVCHVKSTKGAGAVFSLYLPLAGADTSVAAAQGANSNPDLQGNERILVVDDEIDIVDTLTIGLSRLGYDAVGIDDPLAALEAFEEDSKAWDVVVTDQVMPTLRGTELIGRIKAIRPDIHTVLCTGFSDGTDEAAARQAGADAYFRKPMDISAVATAIRRLADASPAKA